MYPLTPIVTLVFTVRPPYKWLLLGPPRSGTPFHVDPLATSAWNACLEGRKRWALYPPGGWDGEGDAWLPPGVKLTRMEDGERSYDAPSSYEWWLTTYPSLDVRERPLEFIQEAGDVVFVPRGWWHTVVNETYMVAYTQNFTSEHNFEDTLSVLKTSDRDLAEVFRCRGTDVATVRAPPATRAAR